MLRMYRYIGYILFVFWQSMIKLSLITIFPHIWDEKIKQMITFPFISAHVVVRSRDNETNAWMTITEEKIQVKDEMSSFFTSPSIILYVSLPLVYYVHEHFMLVVFSVCICFGIVGNNNAMPFLFKVSQKTFDLQKLHALHYFYCVL